MLFAMLMLTVENTSNAKCSRSLLVPDAERDNKRCSHKDSFTFSPSSIKKCVFFAHHFPLCPHISFCTLGDGCQTSQASPTAIIMIVGKVMRLLVASVKDAAATFCCLSLVLLIILYCLGRHMPYIWR